MLRAVLERYGDQPIGAPHELWPAGVPDPLVPLTLPPHGGEFRNARRSPLLLARLAARRALLGLGGRRAERLLGAGSAHGVRVLLDCSGFAYGDAWIPARMLRRHGYYAGLKRRGVRIVFLPQAFGPFEAPEVRQAAARLFALGDAVEARDADSLSHLRALALPERVRLGQCPDITHLLAGEAPPDPEAWRRRVAIVPNARMVDRTPPERAAAYLGFLVRAAEVARGEGCEPWIVVHETNDAKIVDALNARLENPMPVVDIDAVATKGLLGTCRAVVASRYHALVSSLSQGTPVIGTSWSHKYDRLFDEYGHGEFLLRPEIDQDLLATRLRAAIHDPDRSGILGRLADAARAQKARVRGTWDALDDLLKEAGALD